MIIRPVILSGGSGTRMWPISRTHFPKQFAPMIQGQSLFAEALLTVADRKRFAPPMIIGNESHKFLILDTLQRLGLKDALIYLEPLGRNTGAAMMTAALAEKEDCVHLVMPSDHLILDKAAYIKAVETALSCAKEDHFVLFGIQPSRIETGFGYISAEKSEAAVKKIARFHEKPDQNKAQKLIAQGALWNSGIFFYNPKTLLKEAETLAPEHLSLARDALQGAKESYETKTLALAAYEKIPAQPFDRLIMEKTEKGLVLPCEMGWNDLGSWQELWRISSRDEKGTATHGPVIAMDTKDCYLHSTGPTLAVLGLEGINVVATDDAVLVAPLDRTQEVKELVSTLAQKNGTLALEHRRVLRPWGSFEGISNGARFQVKHIIVAPGKSLSLQMHHHRAEHWVVVEGTAKILCNDKEKMVFPNESVYIPKGTKHRLSNPGKIDLHLIEVQSGDYLGEDDIVRFEDEFGRT